MCERVDLGNGNVAIVCGGHAKKTFCACGRESVALCDWKVPAHKSGTCDRPLCASHAKQVARNKHLCPDHQVGYDLWKAKHPAPQRNLFEEAT
jgi:hypothetical protein